MRLPEGYPDEALYSIIARWQIRTGVFDLRSTSERLFEIESTRPVLGIQTGIAPLIKQSSVNADEFIHRHTVYPYYSGPQKWFTTNDILYAPYKYWAYLEEELSLACCPLCIVSDFKNFGEPYWHRTHMLPGVMVCPHHNVMLISHCPTCGQSIADNRWAYQLTPTCCPAGHSLLKEIGNLSKPLLTLSQDSQLVLFSGWNNMSAADLQQVYTDVLTQRATREFENLPHKRRSTYNIFLKTKFYLHLRNEFETYIKNSVLDVLPLNSFKTEGIQYRYLLQKTNRYQFDWFYQFIFRSIGADSSPIAHILFLRFLFGSVQKFYEMNGKKFGCRTVRSEIAVTTESDTDEGY